MRNELEAAHVHFLVQRSATQEAAGRKEKLEDQGQALCDCGPDIGDVRADCHARHARLVQML